jgi:hypothetical protein
MELIGDGETRVLMILFAFQEILLGNRPCKEKKGVSQREADAPYISKIEGGSPILQVTQMRRPLS